MLLYFTAMILLFCTSENRKHCCVSCFPVCSLNCLLFLVFHFSPANRLWVVKLVGKGKWVQIKQNKNIRSNKIAYIWLVNGENRSLKSKQDTVWTTLTSVTLAGTYYLIQNLVALYTVNLFVFFYWTSPALSCRLQLDSHFGIQFHPSQKSIHIS